MSADYFSDTHTLYVKCDCATAEQIRRSFSEALTTYQATTGTKLECRFKVNLVEDRNGTSFKIAFVFVTNSSVYYMLLGKNPDGSDRIEYRDDPSWSPPTDGDVNDAGWSTISPPVFKPGMSWADETEAEEEYQRQVEAEKQRYICPKIPVTLEPLMVLPPYRLTPQQIETKRQKICEENYGKPDFDPSRVDIPELAYFSVSAAIAKPVEHKYMPNILKCKNVPDWVTKDDLKVQFAPYVSDAETPQERSIKGRRIEETYPFVNINDDRVAFIIFDPSTNDAYFALHMMKKTIITKTMGDGSRNSVTLIFGHSFRTDRDIMADISQKPRPVQRRDNPPRQQADGDGYMRQNTVGGGYRRDGYGGGGRGRGRGRGGYGGRDERREDGERAIQHPPPRPWTAKTQAPTRTQGETRNTFAAFGAGAASDSEDE